MEEKQINEILENELQKVVLVAGGSPFSGMSSKAIAKKLPAMSYADKIDIHAANNFMLCEKVLNLQGNIMDSDASEGIITAVVGSGFGNMNPAVLIVKATDEAVFARAAAKEGLIKQHTAEKAIQNLFDKIRQEEFS